MIAVPSTVVDISRWQFATTSIYHFLFVPLTLGLAPLVAGVRVPPLRWFLPANQSISQTTLRAFR